MARSHCSAMQDWKPNSTRPSQASRGPEGPRAAGAGAGAGVVGVAAGRGAGAGADTDSSIAGVVTVRAGSGALLRRPGGLARAAEAARAAAKARAAEAAANGEEAAGSVGVAIDDTLAVLVVRILDVELGVASVGVLAAGTEIGLIVAVGVLATSVGGAAVSGAAGPRVAKKAAIPMTAAPRMPQSIVLDDFGGAELAALDLTRSASKGMGAISALAFGLIAPEAFCTEPGSVIGNCVGANWVLAPYSESL